MKRSVAGAAVIALVCLGAVESVSTDGQGGNSPGRNGCSALPSWGELRQALKQARAEGNGGLNLDMWGTIVDRDGIVCAVAFTGNDRDDQWPGSRVISAQKANTANAFSLTGLSLSTANLYTAVQPGGSLFGLQESNPVDHDVAYRGNAANFGRASDPMVGGLLGGVNVFGGGLALYNENGRIVGGLGVSGDTSCADHNIAYRTRNTLLLDYVPGGVSGDSTRPDNIVFDIAYQAGQMPGASAGGFGHTSCHGYNATGNTTSSGFAATLPPTR